MREIKFRLWCKFESGEYIMLEHAQIDHWALRDLIDGEDHLMEYTGLKDRNGKEIFEDDLLKSGMRVGDGAGWTVEKIVKGEFGEWLLEDLKTGERMQMQRDVRLREIIGNIYENPELCQK